MKMVSLFPSVTHFVYNNAQKVLQAVAVHHISKKKMQKASPRAARETATNSGQKFL